MSVGFQVEGVDDVEKILEVLDRNSFSGTSFLKSAALTRNFWVS